MHELYEIELGHSADFRVKYRFYDKENGGRGIAPIQGTRFDFWYDYEKHTISGVFIIWPEFENEAKEVILDPTEKIKLTGTARMTIMSNERRYYHKDKIKIGLKGYFCEGKKVAECEVIEIIGLQVNPMVNSSSNGV